jgi:uncharacterized protein YndB with AHSA1/START domain
VRIARIGLSLVVVAIGLVVLGVGGFYFAQPSSYRITRARTIAAPPATVMAHLADLHAFEAWDPWPTTSGEVPTVTFGPSSTGPGAWMDRRVSRGDGSRTTIVAASALEIEMANVTSGALGDGASTQTFALREVDGGTEVTWSLAADLHGLARLLWPIAHLDATVGPGMEAALGRLDQACR